MAKVLISLDDRLLRQIDRLARKSGLSRSGYLARLAAQDVARATGPGVTRAVREALARLDELFTGSPVGESVELIRAERDGR
jgi:predicted transcriptional regulator